MRKTFLMIVAMLSCLVAPPLAAAENNVVTEPFVGVRVIHSKSMEPRQVDMWIVEIDPKAPGVSFLVTPSNGGLMGDTTPVTTREFVTKVGAQLGVNGSFFKFAGKGQYDVSGLSVSKGNVYSTFNPGYVDAINISRDGVATVIRATGKDKGTFAKKTSFKSRKPKAPSPNPLPKGEDSKAKGDNSKKADPPVDLGTEHRPDVVLYNALSGRNRLVKNGKNVAGNATEIHPRTGAGVTKDGKLLLFTVDGREPGRSGGMKFSEMADAMIRWGAEDAISLDGGGSTTFVMDDPATAANDPKVMNLPCDPIAKDEKGKEHGKERPVGNNLAVFARKKARGK